MMFTFAVLAAVCIGLPVFYAWRLWRLNKPSMGDWLVAAAEACLVVMLIVIVGRWDIVGMPARILLLALLAAALVRSLLRHAGRPWRPRKLGVSSLVPVVLAGGALAYVATGLTPPDEPADFAFPLRDGRFVVGQGGGGVLLNHHAGHEAQRFAADITAIGPAGFRAAGILPRNPDRYEIFGKQVVSPCEGTVKVAEDGLADLSPPDADANNPAGNHVVLRCGGLQVELAHLQRGSVAVRPGQVVRTGDLLGLVGNSGNSTEPHLHIHAVLPESGKGVPITFAGRFPVRNRTFVNQE